MSTNIEQAKMTTKRIRWKDAELLALGMEMDRLKAVAKLKLLPDVELLIVHAQQALPLERRRNLNETTAREVIDRIELMRVEQTFRETFDDAKIGELPEAFRDVLPTDSEEVKRMAALVSTIQQSEQRIIAEVSAMLDSKVDALYNKLLGDMIEMMSGVMPLAQKKEKVVKQATVIFPSDASWSKDVAAQMKKLKGENVVVTWFGIGQTKADVQSDPLMIEHLKNSAGVPCIIVDSAAHGTADGVARNRMDRVVKQHALTHLKLTHVRCATPAQVIEHVKASV